MAKKKKEICYSGRRRNGRDRSDLFDPVGFFFLPSRLLLCDDLWPTARDFLTCCCIFQSVGAAVALEKWKKNGDTRVRYAAHMTQRLGSVHGRWKQLQVSHLRSRRRQTPSCAKERKKKKGDREREKRIHVAWFHSALSLTSLPSKTQNLYAAIFVCVFHCFHIQVTPGVVSFTLPFKLPGIFR